MRAGERSLALSALAGCSGDSWHLSVYPTGNHLEAIWDMGDFEILEACREEAVALLTAAGTLDRGRWECGKICRDDGQVLDITFYVREETLREALSGRRRRAAGRTGKRSAVHLVERPSR